MPSLEQSQRKSWASICSCSSCKIEAMTAAGYDDSAPVEDGPEELAEARLGCHSVVTHAMYPAPTLHLSKVSTFLSTAAAM